MGHQDTSYPGDDSDRSEEKASREFSKHETALWIAVHLRGWIPADEDYWLNTLGGGFGKGSTLRTQTLLRYYNSGDGILEVIGAMQERGFDVLAICGKTASFASSDQPGIGSSTSGTCNSVGQAILAAAKSAVQQLDALSGKEQER